MLKGIQTAEDAQLAVEHGIEVIYVSNHGGRQLDHARPAIDALVEVLDAVGGRAQVVVDGGFMRGTDVLKALALGASAVGIGRIAALAYAAAGEQGVLRLLELLEQEILTSMALLGCAARDELDARMVSRRAARHGGRQLAARRVSTPRPPRLAGVSGAQPRAWRPSSASTPTISARSAARTRSPSVATPSPASTGTRACATIGPAS